MERLIGMRLQYYLYKIGDEGTIKPSFGRTTAGCTPRSIPFIEPDKEDRYLRCGIRPRGRKVR